MNFNFCYPRPWGGVGTHAPENSTTRWARIEIFWDEINCWRKFKSLWASIVDNSLKISCLACQGPVNYHAGGVRYYSRWRVVSFEKFAKKAILWPLVLTETIRQRRSYIFWQFTYNMIMNYNKNIIDDYLKFIVPVAICTSCKIRVWTMIICENSVIRNTRLCLGWVQRFFS